MTHRVAVRSPREDTSFHLCRAIGGKSESVSWVVERFSPVLLARATIRIGPHLRCFVEPEDVVHDVWCIALPRLGALRSRRGHLTGVLLRYLARVLEYRILRLSEKLLGRRRLRREASSSQQGEFGGKPSSPGRHADAVLSAIRSEDCDAVVRAIESLPRIDRQVLILRALERKENAEVAHLLGIEKGAVATRYHRACRRLRARVPGSLFDELGS